MILYYYYGMERVVNKYNSGFPGVIDHATLSKKVC